MAYTGLSVPVFGEYGYSNSAVAYTNGVIMGHAISYQIDIQETENNNLYGDNMIIETDDGQFQSGTLTLNTSELDQTISKWLLGLTEGTHSFTPTGETSAVSVSEYIYDNRMAPKEVGFGIIEQEIVNNVTKYVPVILTRVKPKIPGRAVTTRGEQIEWQTKELTFDILRDESAYHAWLIEAGEQSSEATAIAYLKDKLGVSSSSS